MRLRAGAPLAARWAAALVLLDASWWIACESLRERVPAALAAFLLTLWPALVWAARPRDPRFERARPLARALLPTLALFLLDALLDAWIPYLPRFVVWPWEPVRLLAAATVFALAPAPPPESRAARTLAALLRDGAALIVLGVAFAAATIVSRARDDRTAPADSALVLGFALDPAGRPLPSLIARVRHGAELYHAGLVRRLFLSGGVVHGTVSEASVMRNLALSYGVPDDALVLEDRSRSTVENFGYSVPLMRARGAGRVLLVTEAYHMPRALLLARRNGLFPRPSIAPSPAWDDPRAATYWVFRDAMFLLAEWVRDPFVKRPAWTATDPSGAR